MPKLRNAPFAIALLLTACTSSQSPPQPQWTAVPVVAKPPAPLPVAHPMPLDLHWVRNSAEYRAAFLQTYALATHRVEELAAGLPTGTWAVTLDGDETVWSNSEFQKEQGTRPFSDEAWDAWVARKQATALPGAAAFLARVRELGGKIAIVTNRAQEECPATEENMRLLDLAFDLLWCKPADTSEKEPRWDAIVAGTTPAGLPPLQILLWVGDNINDFPNLDQRLRFEPAAAYRDFGTRFFLVPNPMYGSFVGNPRE